jgi:putative ABC transport system permease protein
MLVTALRDLRWRRRRFIITMMGTALVFSMSLLMSGLGNAFTVEIDRTLDDQGADLWVAATGADGPYSAGYGITADLVDAVRTSPGIAAASPLVLGGAVADVKGTLVNVNVFGVQPDGLGPPHHAIEGDPVPRPGTVVVPERLDLDVGDTVLLSGDEYEVSGVVAKASLVAGTSTVFLTIGDARELLLGGLPLASMILVAGEAPTLPSTVVGFTQSEARADLVRPLRNAIQSVNFIKVLLWMVAALIVASVVYMTALERTRDIAVFKATGVSMAAIGAGVCLQAVIVAVGASLIGIVVAIALAPRFPMEVVVPARSLLALPLLAIGVGLVAGLFGVRKAASVEPAAAFGGP